MANFIKKITKFSAPRPTAVATAAAAAVATLSDRYVASSETMAPWPPQWRCFPADI